MPINFDHLDLAAFIQKATDLADCIRDHSALPLNKPENRNEVRARGGASKKRFLKEAKHLGVSLTLRQCDYVGDPRVSHAVFSVLLCVENFRPEVFGFVQSAKRLEEALAMLARATGKGSEAGTVNVPINRKAKRIRPDKRTKPMSYRQAARLMGKGDSKDAAEWLSASVKEGSIPCEHISRQTHIFSSDEFPAKPYKHIGIEAP